MNNIVEQALDSGFDVLEIPEKQWAGRDLVAFLDPAYGKDSTMTIAIKEDRQTAEVLKAEWVKFKRLVERTPTGFSYSEGLPEFIGFDAMAFRPFRTAKDCADWIAQERPGCVVEWNIQRE